MKISKGLKQAYDLQDFAYEAALALKERLYDEDIKGMLVRRDDASAIASLIKAWESCQERIRIHRNKPLPGVLKPEKPNSKRKAKVSPVLDPVPLT